MKDESLGQERILKWIRLASQGPLADVLLPKFQCPYFLFLPELSSQPWHDPIDFSWTLSFKNNRHFILQEFEDLLQSGRGFQPYHEAVGRQKYWTGEWNTCFLLYNDHEFIENTKLLPETMKLIKSIPLLGEFAMISSLNPQSKIAPHCGPWNARLTCHFGLKIPDMCSLRVADEERQWCEGDFLVFDDSYIHEAKNEGQETRFILLIDTWHPQLRSSEIAMFKKLSSMLQIIDSEALSKNLGVLEGRKWWL